MNKKYLIGALLLIGGYIAYKKFFVKKDDSTTTDDTTSTSATSDIPVNRGVVAPVYEPAPPMVVTQSEPTLVIPKSTSSISLNNGKLNVTDNVATQSSSLPSNFAGLGKY